MADTPTSAQQRAALHSAIWKIADDLRGAVDGWDFKSYVLGFLFYRFISEDLTRDLDNEQRRVVGPSFSYAALTDDMAAYDRDEIIREKGIYIAPSELFCNVACTCHKDPNLNETLEGIFRNIENSSHNPHSENCFSGLLGDMDLNSNKLGATVSERNERLCKIIDGIAGLDFGPVDEAQIDLFGDAYEYLMNMYASNAGKSGGEFFTPQEVSELLARIVIGDKEQINKIYDPACGSGSLLLKAAKVIGRENILQGFYGQEKNITTYNLCRINMILHGVNFTKFNIALGDTLVDPKHWNDEPFDAIVSNPPYSIKWVGDDDPTLINDPRFAPAGVLAPKTKADLAFTMHILSWLAEGGTAAIVEFPGVLYRGGKERQIRKYLVDNNFVKAVIQLPSNLFFGVGIATCIIVLAKGKADDKIQFVDASELFGHEGNKNKLMPEHIERIFQTVNDRTEEDHFSRLVPIDVVGDEDNDYNLSVGTYVEKPDTREKVDIVELNERLERIVRREAELRAQIDAIVADLEA